MEKENRNLLFIFFTLLFIALFGWQSVMELRGEEPRRAVISFEMIYYSSYWVPTLNGWDYFNKPPLFNWIQALFIQGIGSMDEWVVRLPSNISFLFTGVIIFFTANRYLGRPTAILSTISFLTFGDLLFFATVTSGEMDLFFVLLVVLQIVSIWIGLMEKNHMILFLGSFFFAALGTMTKGPPSIAFQVLTLYPTLFILKKWKLLFSPYHVLGIVIFSSIGVGYFAIYSHQGGDAIGYGIRLIKESSQRTAFEQPILSVILGIIEFPLTIIKLMFPWSIAFVLFLNKAVRQELIKNEFIKLLFIFLIFNLPLYWIKSDHKSRYVYMFLPILGIITSYAIHHISLIKPNTQKIQTKLISGLIIFAIALLLAVPMFLPVDIPYIYLKLIFTIACCSLVLFLTLKIQHQRFLLLAIFLVVFRIGVNMIYLPINDLNPDRISTRKSISHLCEVAEYKPIHLLGGQYQHHSNLTIAGFSLFDFKHDTAPEMPFAIPYYIIKNTGHPMNFELTPTKGQIYIYNKKDHYKLNSAIRDELGDDWYNKKWNVGLAD